ncbi:hypothetical protein PCE1_000660 [Barthelona sp. PCE]
MRILLFLTLLIAVFGFECRDSLPEQMMCANPAVNEYQQPDNCRFGDVYNATCTTFSGLTCDGPTTFTIERECVYITGKSFYTALVLNALLGWLGVDRFYLGYPTLGFIKLFTFGGFFVFNIFDTILLLLGITRPADGSHFYNYPIMKRASIDRPQLYLPLVFGEATE